MSKKLKLWNGRPYGVLPASQWAKAHIYVAAYSVEDARRVCVEAGYSDPGRHEIQTFWHAGCWGDSMKGIPVERGLWVGVNYDTPQKMNARHETAGELK